MNNHPLNPLKKKQVKQSVCLLVFYVFFALSFVFSFLFFVTVIFLKMLLNRGVQLKGLERDFFLQTVQR